MAAYTRTFTPFFNFFTLQVFLKQNKELKSDARIISEYSNLSAVTLVVGFADSLCVDFQTIGGLEQGNSAGAVVRETSVVERAENVFSGRHAGHAVQLHSRGFVHFSLRCEKVRVWVRQRFAHFCLRIVSGITFYAEFPNPLIKSTLEHVLTHTRARARTHARTHAPPPPPPPHTHTHTASLN